MILIPLALLIGFILSCTVMKCCKKEKVNDIVLRIEEEDADKTG